MMLSRHFSLAEMTVSRTAARMGMNNTPGPEEMANLRRLAESLEKVRAWLYKPVIVLSGYRCQALNTAVGGAYQSAHMRGLAADIICPAYGKVIDVFEAVRRSGIIYDQLIAERPGDNGWIHIGLADRARRRALIFDGKRYTEVT
jgi:hypothetical protein